jgi:peptide/nickel transport system ATP-binding protein
MIAMALACGPNLVIADEPTTALDVMVQAQVLALLKNLQRELGLAMLFITHDLSVLVEVSDRLAIMYAGKVVEQGPSRAVFDDPAHPYTRALAAAFPSIGEARFRRNPSGLGGDPPDPQAIPSGCPFHPRCPVAFDACPTIVPDLYSTGEGRLAACLLVEGALVDAPGAVD